MGFSAPLDPVVVGVAGAVVVVILAIVLGLPAVVALDVVNSGDVVTTVVVALVTSCVVPAFELMIWNGLVHCSMVVFDSSLILIP
jgi:hypothetical protein